MKLEDAQALSSERAAIFVDKRQGTWFLAGWIWAEGDLLPSRTRSHDSGKTWWPGSRLPRNFIIAEEIAKKAKSLRRIHGWKPYKPMSPLHLLARTADAIFDPYEGKEGHERVEVGGASSD
jgi:hypothetical protein